VLQAVILTDEEKMIVTPTYHVMEMYNVHQDALMIPTTLVTNSYTMGDEKLSALSVSASKDKNGFTHISITNIDAHNAAPITIFLDGLPAKAVTGRILKSEKLQDHNTFNDANKVAPETFTGATLNGDNITLTAPPFSVIVLELK
jgi:alpha-N-arabinofuranosidase